METLPPDVLSEVDKAVEEKVSSFQKSTHGQQKKRRIVGLKGNTSQRAKPAAKKSTEGDVSWRSTQDKNCKQETKLFIAITNPLQMDQMLPTAEGLTTTHALPIFLDKSAVPWGQMLPVCQDQSIAASFQSVEDNWMNPTIAFINPTSFTFSSVRTSCSLPLKVLDPSSIYILGDVPGVLADPVDLSSIDFGPDCSPSLQTTMVGTTLPPGEQSYIDTSLLDPSDSVSALAFTNQPLVPVFESANSRFDSVAPENGNLPVSDAPCEPPLLQGSDLHSSSPLTAGPQDAVSPFWLDFLLNANNA